MNTCLRTNRIATTSGVHTHEYPQIFIGRRGRMRCELPGQSADMTRGSLALMPSTVEHRYRGESPECQVLVIDLNLHDPFVTALEDACSTRFERTLFSDAAFVSSRQSLLPLLDWADLQLAGAPVEPLQTALQYQLITMFLTQLTLFSGAGHQRLERSGRLNLERLDRYIDAHLDRPIENAELAERVHLSVSHLYASIKLALGISPQQYVMRRRLEKARELLRTRHLSLLDIALHLGFADGSSLSRAYRRYYGHPPGQERR